MRQVLLSVRRYKLLTIDFPCTVIHHVTVGGIKAEAFQWDPMTNMSISNPKDGHLHPELKRRVYSAYAESDEGELSIAIPRETTLIMTEHSSRSKCRISTESSSHTDDEFIGATPAL
jgi:hypothetical protein